MPGSGSTSGGVRLWCSSRLLARTAMSWKWEEMLSKLRMRSERVRAAVQLRGKSIYRPRVNLAIKVAFMQARLFRNSDGRRLPVCTHIALALIYAHKDAAKRGARTATNSRPGLLASDFESRAAFCSCMTAPLLLDLLSTVQCSTSRSLLNIFCLTDCPILSWCTLCPPLWRFGLGCHTTDQSLPRM